MTGNQSEYPPLNPDRAPWLFEDELQDILGLLNEDNAVTRAVGGAVRNTLMGLPVSDVDLATTLLPEHVLERGRKQGYTVVETGLDHGTVTLVAGTPEHRHSVEVTTLRTDVETHGRHATVAFTEDWTADAQRRDFTINAIYCDGDGTLYDPVCGIPDIESRTVRFVGSPAERIAEDYLRIFRFFRFSAQYAGGATEPEALAACVAGKTGIAQLSSERIRQELLKLLVAPGAVPVVETMVLNGFLERIGGAGVSHAQFEALAGIESIQGMAPGVLRRLAALFLAGELGADDLQERLRLSREQTKHLASIEECPSVLVPESGEREHKELLYRLGEETYRDATLLAWARSGETHDDTRWSDMVTLPVRWIPPEFPLTGADIVEQGVAPGPDVGRILKRLERHWIDQGFSDGRDALLALIGKYR